MLPTFQFNVGQQITERFVTYGHFEDENPSLALATTGGKILLHSPHESGVSTGEMPHVRFLNFNKKITSLATGCIAERNEDAPQKDMLYVGTQSTLLGYDVERNSDVFFREVPDGVNALLVGRLCNMKPLVFAGGNCSVLGFNSTGTESFWTVTGDNVSALALVDVNSDGLHELVVGSEDFEIRFFQNEELIGEQTEADKVTFLSPVDRALFSYGLANGTVGMYSGMRNRLWRVKTKHRVTAVTSYDLNADGVPEVISGWSNGMVSVRSIDNGESLYKFTMPAPVATILSGDYRMDGKEELMVCSVNGDITGYLPTDFEMIPATLSDGHAGGEVGGAPAPTGDEKLLDELQKKKLDLSNELRTLEKNIKGIKSNDGPTPGGLSADTTLAYTLEADPLRKGVLLTVEASTDVQVASVIVIDLESVILAGNEILTVTPSLPSRNASVLIRPSRHSTCQLRVQTHVAVRGFASNLYVFEEIFSVPKFASFAQTPETEQIAAPLSSVAFRMNEDISRFISWMQSSFIILSVPKIVQDKLRVQFISVCSPGEAVSGDDSSAKRSGLPLFLFAARDGDSINVQIRCDSMELTAEVVQDIAKFFKITELESHVNFPKEMTEFEEVLKQVAEFNALRIRMSADMADDSQRVKALIVRAEDARLMVDSETMCRAYTDLYSLNNQLMAGYLNRQRSHEGLLAALKEVNQMIQRSANLRVGAAKTRVINDSRVAVKANNMQSLFRIIRQGYDAPTQGAKK